MNENTLSLSMPCNQSVRVQMLPSSSYIVDAMVNNYHYPVRDQATLQCQLDW